MAHILVVDDEPKLGQLVAEMLGLDGHPVTRVLGGRAALSELSAHTYELVVTDLKMPEVDGLAVLQHARALVKPPRVMLMTAFGSADNAVAAMKAGAVDYLTKPFSMDELRLRVRRLVAELQAEAKSAQLVDRLTPALVAESPAMQRVVAQARQVAPTDASVLLLGESGTGKSQLARFIHFQSRRSSGPLSEVHCAALSESLLESELFGHEKGAFTGAADRKMGHLGAAHEGTLFLDEVGEISPATQVKLLRFLQEREFVAVGATAARKVDVRVVAATNRDLEAAVRQGSFREDFYYRLNVFSLKVPPLRERREDILPLARRLLARRGLPPDKLSPEAESLIEQHRWPGNVRELENALERALILAAEEPLRADHFALSPSRAVARVSLASAVLGEGFNLDVFERELLEAALLRAGGNKTAAAKLLGITRRRLYSRMESLNAKAGPEVDG